MKKTVKKGYLSGGRKLMAGILAAGLLLTCGCGNTGETGNAENGKSGWGADMGKVQAAEDGQPDRDGTDGGAEVSDDSRNDGSGIEDAAREVLAYILKFDGKTLTYDEMEWVDIPSERAEELELEDEGSGFTVYNANAKEMAKCTVADDCVCMVLDWTENYVMTEVTPQEFSELLEERDAPNIPYALTIKGGQVIAVQEHYVP